MSETGMMQIQTDLKTILRELRPTLLPSVYVFCSLPDAHYGAVSELSPLACFQEAEGLSVILPRESADRVSLPYEGLFRCISLQVFSSLNAVGLTAVVSTTLTAQGISANVVAATHHDHVFVPVDRAQEALVLLQSLRGTEPY